jgi:P pilus assembly chaperone PapD
MTATSRSAAIVKVGACLASVLVAGVLAVAQTRDNKPAAGVMPQFNITPTRLFIPKGQTSASLVLRNEGAEALRFQITAFAWSNDADGHLVLQPTTDVIFFPVLFAVDPGQTRRVRVAVTLKAIERELSYRLFVEQLPSRAEAQPSGVRMLMRASIPLFVQPPQLVVRAMVDEAKVAGGQLSFVVDDAFAVVKVGDVAGVRVMASNQLVGRTNRRGEAVVPNLVSYYGNRLSIVPGGCADHICDCSAGVCDCAGVAGRSLRAVRCLADPSRDGTLCHRRSAVDRADRAGVWRSARQRRRGFSARQAR